ncbi:hypothetical protein CDAR_547651 [Caerostris darwini]|uniref:Uncharacterized protein n=1 Tax=Caerostris darwini TaxID=1538125 RepID=A0AAV4MM33_9ARAC|nr:hypothetical protein CDAR_547651 [Caerostris darwini]
MLSLLIAPHIEAENESPIASDGPRRKVKSITKEGHRIQESEHMWSRNKYRLFSTTNDETSNFLCSQKKGNQHPYSLLCEICLPSKGHDDKAQTIC